MFSTQMHDQWSALLLVYLCCMTILEIGACCQVYLESRTLVPDDVLDFHHP